MWSEEGETSANAFEQMAAQFLLKLTPAQTPPKSPGDLDKLLKTRFFQLARQKNLAPLGPMNLTNGGSLSLLERLYERSIGQGELTKEGIFYTPEWLAAKMVTTTIAEATSPPTLIDPACGGGAFLIAAAEAYLRRFGQVDLSKYLFGVDRDPLAVELVKVVLNLWLAASGMAALDWSKNFVVGDSLLEVDAPQKLLDGNCFDIVIGNPPYGISRDEKLSVTEIAALRQKFPLLRSGKINKYLAFFCQGLNWLAPHGRLSLVVPNSWLGIQEMKNFRHFLFEQNLLEEVQVFTEPVFKKVGVEVVVTTLRRDDNRKFINLVRVQKDSQFIQQINRKCWLQSPDLVVPVGSSDVTLTLVANLQRTCVPLAELSDYFKVMIALQAYARGKGKPLQTEADSQTQSFHAFSALDDTYLPYLEGKDVSRFAINWSGRFLSHGPWLAEPQKLERFTGPRVLIREILGKRPHLVHAVFTSESLLYNKSILHVLPGPQAKADLLRLLCFILNSKVASFQLLQYGRKTQRGLFPKLLAADLRSLLIPKAIFDRAVLPSIDDVDSFVFDLFALSSADRQTIEDAVIS